MEERGAPRVVSSMKWSRVQKVSACLVFVAPPGGFALFGIGGSFGGAAIALALIDEDMRNGWVS